MISVTVDRVGVGLLCLARLYGKDAGCSQRGRNDVLEASDWGPGS